MRNLIRIVEIVDTLAIFGIVALFISLGPKKFDVLAISIPVAVVFVILILLRIWSEEKAQKRKRKIIYPVGYRPEIDIHPPEYVEPDEIEYADNPIRRLTK
jgi:hypothetical protein